MSVSDGNREYEVIDFHVHTFPDKIAEAAVSKLQKISGLTPQTDGRLSTTLKKLQDCHVDRAVLLNIATSPRQQGTVNDTAAEINANFGTVFTAFGSVHFQAEDALSELERIKALGIKGVKLHPDYQDFMIDDKVLYPIYECCSALSLPIVFHAGWDCYSPALIHAPPSRSAKVLADFPKLKVVLAHFGGLKLWDEVEEHLIGKDVWLDTAMCATYGDAKEIARLMKKHDENRLLFGSDCPWENPADSMSFLLSMELPYQTKAKIFSGNAKVLLNENGIAD